MNDKGLAAIYRDRAFPIKHPDLMERNEFLPALAKMIKEKGIRLATGSDAHKLEDIGFLAHARRFMDENNIDKGLVVSLEDFQSPGKK